MLQTIYDAIDPILFQIGFFTVRWYGLAYVVGFVAAALIVWRIVKRWRLSITLDDLLTIILGAALGTVIGGRLGYVLFYNLDRYIQNPLEIFQLSGMSFHGGLIGILIAGAIVAKIIKMPLLTLADLGAIAAPVGLFFGRCANFINGELWGKETDLPWGVVFDTGGLMARHPSQLYEAVLEGLVIFIILFIMTRRRQPYPRGTFFGVFMVLYGVFRFLIEFVRVPDSHLGYLSGWLTMGQVLSLPLIVLGIVVLVYAMRAKLPQQGRVLPAEEDVRVDDVSAEGDLQVENDKSDGETE